MALFLSTTGFDVVISELGITIPHPTVDFQIDDQFSSKEISRAVSLTQAIRGGDLIWRKESSGPDEEPLDYDEDWVRVSQLSTGPGSFLDRIIKQSDIADFESSDQLDDRDLENRKRSNHTGSQTASTISDFNSAADSRVNLHADLTNNPHGVSKSQVGLGNVDNTSDVNKPVSIAQQAALDLKYDASNPNNYETTAQLNARDTVNRARANHTGTQLSSTISDFASTVRNTILTGFTIGANAAVIASDSILQAFGKVQAQINYILSLFSSRISVRATGEVQTTSTNFVDLNGMAITPVAGTYLVFAMAQTRQHQNNNQGARYNISIDNSAVANTQLELIRGGTQTSSVSMTYNMSCEVTVNGSQAIKIRWQSTVNNTARTFGRYLTLIRVA